MLSRFDTIPERDRQTDRQMDRIAVHQYNGEHDKKSQIKGVIISLYIKFQKEVSIATCFKISVRVIRG